MNFNELNISPDILRAISDMGFETATEIQEKAIPLILDGEDIIGQSQTGTGKTAAFAIPILEKIDPDIRRPQVLVLCPTRELAVQVCNEFDKLTKYTKIKATAIFGGDSMPRQISALKRGVHIVIGTPGRTIDHMKRRTLKMEYMNSIILDEADEMLNMGFREDIEDILEHIANDDIQTILFSATMPKPILEIAKSYQNDPKVVKITRKELSADTIEQRYYNVREQYKNEVLRRLLDVSNSKLTLIFCNTKKRVDEVTDLLQHRGYACDKIHGDMKQVVRLNVLDKFNSGIINILVATDVAARGLDIKNVESVINYDVPENEEYYVHRIGRTGRAGKKGTSHTLVSKRDIRRLNNVMHYIKKDISKNKIPSVESVNEVKITSCVDTIIAKIENSSNLPKYQGIIEELNARGYTSDKIAAALLADSLELREDTNKNLGFEGKKHGNSRHGSNRGGSRNSKGREKGMSRLYFNVGANNKVAVKDMVGAIAGEAKIKGSAIGSIDIFDKYTFVDIPDKYADKVIKKMNKARIRGKKVLVERANTRKK